MASTWSKLTGSLGRLRQGQKPPEDPRSFPSRGFSLIDQSQKVEEEELPDYVADRFYPVRLGRVFHGRYKTIAKLGFGSSSTIWLARDLSDHRYVALKVYVHTSRFHRELPLYKDMSPKLATTENAGRKNIRQLLDSFEIDGPHGQHVALVFQPAQMSLRDMKLVFRKEGGFDEMSVKGAVEELLKALDFLHSEAHVVHTDIHPGNLLLGLNDDSLLRPLEDQEFSSPVARKARSGPGPHAGDIMPIQCRAPEAIMCISWSYPVDIWSVGLTAWDLLGPKRLFTAKDEDGDMYDAAHLAELIATLGPPPLEFLRRNSERAADFWNENGDWLGLAPIPPNRTLEELETRLKDPSRFIAFLRRVLTWVPEERPTAKELLQDPWLRG
ncbi:kinase-like domain-containing protein [Fusarium solani]|uniref:non-specific serine/threonine protein kinase n=1 Tax=Fusarium solani TaxID=169388 RepID=A0A9P9KUL1_FUSSL|nr:kinase-like domain-containing protein [Fusarium solani]KAH7268816.1 kinase-like domain-containing protein [Fusarium solani]